ncbi:LysR family transcriptional regulator [Nitratireductor sp. XY-223]|uniref:LysR family transcriptional regulator n=1 Tax=Nitratireductor sp. XY-223 TaxID=2561926 RepID=UPI0010AA7141|nr:LysR family transcriptional regulator [Nitratireductor sp. XY-223]
MNLDLKHFRAFVAVADKLHFTKAANEIHVSQPTLTLLIQQLEAAVGVALINRSTRQVELTDMGRELLPMAVNVVNGTEAAIDYMQDFVKLKRGKVTIASLPSALINLLPKPIVEFRRNSPNVSLRIIDGITDVVTANVREGVADFGVAHVAPDTSEFNFTHLYDDDLMLLMLKDHPFARRRFIPWEAIRGKEVIMSSQETGIRHLIDKVPAAREAVSNVILEPTMISTVVAMVAAGAGLGVVLSSYIDAIADDRLVAKHFVDPTISRSVGIITRANYTLTPPARTMFDMIEQEARN